jgi:hypothetical protein
MTDTMSSQNIDLSSWDNLLNAQWRNVYCRSVFDSCEKRSVCIHTYLRTELSPSWEAANCAAIQNIPSNFKEPEGSSPCSEEPSTDPYPEPVRSSPYHPTVSLKDPYSPI